MKEDRNLGSRKLLGWLRWCGALALLSSPAANAQPWPGFYTDRPSYAVGDTVNVHASTTAPNTQLVVRLVRVGAVWTEVARTTTLSVSPQATRLGSFVEFPSVDMAGMTAFTLEGWWLPTLVGGDVSILAGQMSAATAAAGLGVGADGHLLAYTSTESPLDPSRSVRAPQVLSLDVWHHVAATYDGVTLRLFVEGQEVASGARTGAVATTGLPFRLGARAEAPGDQTGVIDGRMDSWALWPRALAPSEIEARRARGLSEENPAPAPNEVTLYAGFEDAYGQGVSDTSINSAFGVLVNHGTPRVAGVFGNGMALRLNHDQLVDANWPVAASLTIPPNAPPGLYSVQVLLPPDFDPDDRSPDLFSAIAVRPTTPTPGTKIAVIIPVNTWNAYNAWPGDVGGNIAGITPRSRVPGGTATRGAGNNSVYSTVGDGISNNFFAGWNRPNKGASVVRVEDATGFSHLASMSVHLLRWLDDSRIPYDVYTERDLDDGFVPVNGLYKVLLFHSHTEYWSQKELDATNAFMNQGGSIINLSGNTLAWRMAHSGSVSEVRKWPHYNIGHGYGDNHSAMDGQRIGYWRALQMCSGSTDDFVLGTTSNDGTAACAAGPTCFGRWSAMNPAHWLWGNASVVDGQLFGTSHTGANVVGHEFDTFEPSHVPLGLAPGTEAVVLAKGVQFGANVTMIDYAALDALSCSDLDADNATSNVASVSTTFNGATGSGGHIVYYQHQAGGGVLSIGAVATASALGADAVLTGLVRTAVDCFALGTGCGDAATITDGGVDSGALGAGDGAVLWPDAGAQGLTDASDASVSSSDAGAPGPTDGSVSLVDSGRQNLGDAGDGSVALSADSGTTANGDADGLQPCGCTATGRADERGLIPPSLLSLLGLLVCSRRGARSV